MFTEKYPPLSAKLKRQTDCLSRIEEIFIDKKTIAFAQKLSEFLFARAFWFSRSASRRGDFLARQKECDNRFKIKISNSTLLTVLK